MAMCIYMVAYVTMHRHLHAPYIYIYTYIPSYIHTRVNKVLAITWLYLKIYIYIYRERGVIYLYIHTYLTTTIYTHSYVFRYLHTYSKATAYSWIAAASLRLPGAGHRLPAVATNTTRPPMHRVTPWVLP